MALTPGLLLDGASGVVFAVFGIIALLVRPRRDAMIAFGIFAIAFGFRMFWYNVVRNAFGGVWDLDIPALGTASVAFAWFMWRYLGGAPRRELAIAGTITLFHLGVWVTFSIVHGRALDRTANSVVYEGVVAAMFFALTLIALRMARETDPRSRRALGLVALALVLFPSLSDGMSVVGVGTLQGIEPYLLVAPSALVVFWMRAAVKTRWEAYPLAVAIAIPTLFIAGDVLASAMGFRAANDSGALGAARTMSVALLALAFWRGGHFGTGIAIQRGTIATALLATVLIVAQIAQNFLAAQYGLLMGGVVAGAFLFAAAPLQRAMERVGAQHEHARTPLGDGRDVVTLADDEIYRAALRVALRDKRLTRDEEIQLHRLATRLGIPGERAHAMLVEVEREMGAPP